MRSQQGIILSNTFSLQILLQIQSENNFLNLPINTNKPNFVVCMVFVGAADSFATKKTIAKQDAILIPVPNSE